MNAIVEHLESKIEALIKDRDELQEKITAMCKAIPGYDWSGDSEKAIAGLAKERDVAVRKLNALSDINALKNLYQAGLSQEYEITELTKERDECRRQSDLQMNSAIKFCQERNAARIERDALIADVARLADRQKSFEKGVTDAGIYLKAKRDALTAAAKLALDELHEAQTADDGMAKWDRNKSAITALRQAGVQ